MTTTFSPPPPERPHLPLMDDAVSRENMLNLSRCDGLSRNWWTVAIRGVAALLFGLIALLLPSAALVSLALVFAAYLLTDGVFAIVAGIRAGRRGERWWTFLLEGLVNLGAGALTLLWPGLTVLAFVLLAAAWAVVSGVLMFLSSRRLTQRHGRWLMALGGAVSFVWGVLLVVAPMAGAIVLTWWMGGYALLFGATLMVLAVRLRRRQHEGARSPQPATP